MLEPKREYAIEPYYGSIGDFGQNERVKPSTRKYTIIQSLWTRPILEKVDTSAGYGGSSKADSVNKLCKTIYLAALSLAYAHRSGYNVHMHTDSLGVELMKEFGYEKLLNTLDLIPESVPAELFAAGKFFAMQAEGRVGKVHIDIDVFLKKKGVIDKFYEDKTIDCICQQVEDYEHLCFHEDKIRAMHALGYPASTYPEWRGSMNTGTIGFNNPALAAEYIDNYFEALNMYTKKKFEQYKKKDKNACMLFDFILEQVNLSFMSRGYNVYMLVPTLNPNPVANEIGYQHLQGGNKWSEESASKVRTKLINIDRNLYHAARRAALKMGKLTD